MTKQEIEILEKSQPTLYIKRYVHTPIPLKDFVDLLINELVVKMSTYEIGKKEIVCHPNKNRSFGSLYRIVLSYYPLTSVEELQNILTELIKAKRVKTLMCNDIHKIVFFKANHYFGSRNYGIQADEYKQSFNFGTHTWN